MKRILVSVFALAAIPFASAQKLVIKGSDTLGAKLVPALAAEYQTKHSGAVIEITAEGSTTGIAAVIDGTAHIGMSSREARATEVSAGRARNVTLKPTVIAYDGMAVIVNAGNPLAKLTAAQVEQIFTGDIAEWSVVGGATGKISLYTRNTSSGTYSDWKELAMKKRDYAPSSQKMAGNEQIVAAVAKDPHGIGYVGLGYVRAPGIKVIPINGIEPAKEKVLAREYPYARPTFLYTNGEPQGEAAKFIEFTISRAGQEIVEQSGFVAVR